MKTKNTTSRKRSTKSETMEARKQIAIMLGTGMPVMQIAKLMNVSRQHVHSHIQRMKKMGMLTVLKKASAVTPRKTSEPTRTESTAWTMNTPFGQIMLRDGASIKITGRKAEITW